MRTDEPARELILVESGVGRDPPQRLDEVPLRVVGEGLGSPLGEREDAAAEDAPRPHLSAVLPGEREGCRSGLWVKDAERHLHDD